MSEFLLWKHQPFLLCFEAEVFVLEQWWCGCALCTSHGNDREAQL
jgi:hypothetical protein